MEQESVSRMTRQPESVSWAAEKKIHGKTRNMRNTRNRKRWSRKNATTSNRKRSAIGSENIKRKIKRSKGR
jgi:hypothetical protein